jgi:isopentenyl-diphosphate delta-isomerase
MSDQIVIVDENDEIIGSKPRTERALGDICRVAGLWIFNEKDELLLAQRSKRKLHDAGKWGTSVAGTVEEGETYESNINKEAEEELGLANLSFTKGKRLMCGKVNRYFCQWFFVTLPSSTRFTLQEDEVDAVRWISMNDLKKEVKEHPEDFIWELGFGVAFQAFPDGMIIG